MSKLNTSDGFNKFRNSVSNVLITPSTSTRVNTSDYTNMLIPSVQLSALPTGLKITNTSSLVILGEPTQSTNQTITNSHPLHVNAGISTFSGGLSASQPTMLRTSNTTQSVISGVDTKITFWGSEINTESRNYISYASGDITISLKGWYYISVSIDSTATPGGTRTIQILKGSTVIASSTNSTNASSNIVTVSTIDFADTINSVYSIRTSGDYPSLTLPNTPTRNRFAVTKIA